VVEDGFCSADSRLGQLATLGSNPVTRVAQGLDGMALGSYTGVLLSATAVPLWAETATILPPLFLSSAFSTGAAAITLVRALSGEELAELHRLDRIEQGAIISELALLSYAALKVKPEVLQPALTRQNKFLFAGAIGLGQLGPLLLQMLRPKHGPLSRVFAIVSSLMALTGGFLLRVAVIEAGKVTAESAAAYHATTSGQGRATPAEQAERYRRIIN
jgi:formate-dependent nitrite reductase membrane component NrfD